MKQNERLSGISRLSENATFIPKNTPHLRKDYRCGVDEKGWLSHDPARASIKSPHVINQIGVCAVPIYDLLKCFTVAL